MFEDSIFFSASSKQDFQPYHRYGAQFGFGHAFPVNCRVGPKLILVGADCIFSL